ncbi:COG1470 family protein [Methanosarcina sp. Mfa9]|uniref:COG1470 family protein n=1 Tax=Methanosarcina sp. Mfa9 TaxID=3439063 RepID=UPI003F8546FB
MKTKMKFLLISVLVFSLVLSGCVSPSQPEEPSSDVGISDVEGPDASSVSFIEGEDISGNGDGTEDSSLPDVKSRAEYVSSLIYSVTLFPTNATSGAIINISVEAAPEVEAVEIAGEDAGLVNDNGTWKGSIIAPSEAGAYALEITARDGSGGCAEASVPYRVLLLEGGADITVFPRANNVTAGEEVLVNIKVKNTQNIDDVFSVYLDTGSSEVPEGSQAEPGWFEWTEKTVELRTGQDVSLPLSIRVSEGISPGYRLFSAKVVSETSKVQGFDTGYLLVS